MFLTRITSCEEAAIQDVIETVADLNHHEGHPAFIRKKISKIAGMDGFHPLLVLAEKNALLPRSTMRTLAYRHSSVSVEDCLEFACEKNRVDLHTIKSSSRSQRLWEARTDAIYFIKFLTGAGVESIGEELGGRDPKTIAQHLNIVAERMQDRNLRLRYLMLGSHLDRLGRFHKNNHSESYDELKDPFWSNIYQAKQDAERQKKSMCH